MKAKLPLAIVALCLLAGVPLAGASDAAPCAGASTPSWSLLGTVYWGATTAGTAGTRTDLYVETNGLEGLQKSPTTCPDGTERPADTCLARYEASLTYCLAQHAADATP